MISNRVKENTNYIFTFGKSGVGKSTLLSVVSSYLIHHKEVNLIPNTERNREGSKILINDWLHNLNNNKFPPRSLIGEILQIEAALENLSTGDLIPLTLLEMSGEDLRKIESRTEMNENEERLEEKFIGFIKRMDICILVTSVEEAKIDDLLLWQFLVKLQNNGIDVPIVLVISKWDELEEKLKSSINPIKFVEMNMPITNKHFKRTSLLNANIFSFSIGQVENGDINMVDLESVSKITSWIYDSILIRQKIKKLKNRTNIGNTK